MKNFFVKCFTVLSLAFTFSTSDAAAEMNSLTNVRLLDHVPERALARASLLNSLNASTPVGVTFTLPLRNQEELDPTDRSHL